MFDTHCHLNSVIFPTDVFPIVKAAREAGVKYFMVPSFDIKSSVKSIAVAGLFDQAYPAIGFHPTKNIEEIGIERIVSDLSHLLEKNLAVTTIGEIGLDYYHPKSSARIQKDLLVELLKIAIKSDKAIILHSRQAAEDVLPILTKMGVSNFADKLVFHCCEPNLALLKFAEKNHYYVGVDGDITYDSAKQAFIREVPLEILVAETDAPYLMPEPFRSMKPRPAYNEPKNVALVIAKIAEIKGVSVEKVISQTTSNAKKLFGL